ncbi:MULTISPECIES: acyl-CoA carboxylase epsilon subunit [unclassified Microbispora]|uniref:acyl-CoA carboxylase epsilon subunit n=1 Tax=unclassified Microbispora TaxID=2614687 RepID=UPI001601A672|nr:MULTISPECIES: acyl-CoA carboxylase epsilon subunit [unclassified Microbispora]
MEDSTDLIVVRGDPTPEELAAVVAVVAAVAARAGSAAAAPEPPAAPVSPWASAWAAFAWLAPGPRPVARGAWSSPNVRWHWIA